MFRIITGEFHANICADERALARKLVRRCTHLANLPISDIERSAASTTRMPLHLTAGCILIASQITQEPIFCHFS